MRANFKVMILLAVVCGGGAVWAGSRWLDSAASQRMREIEANRPDISFKTMVVAAAPLRFGAVLERTSVKEIPWPNNELPPGAYATADDLFKDGERTVLFPLEPSEPVLATKLTGPGERAALSRLISDGNRAVTLRVNDVAGVGGFVLPGDRVDIVLTTASAAEVILQDVRILSIDQMADEKTAEPLLAHTVTVDASPDAAQKLVFAQSVGALSLVLRRAGEVRATVFRPITLSDLTTARTTENKAAPMAAALAPPSTDATVWVRRASELTQYSVPTVDGGPSRRIGPAPTVPPDPAASGSATPSPLAQASAGAVPPSLVGLPQ